ncbi:hypothetical protein HOT31_gp028 [Microbacterium phage Hendrix]|uniref:Uncharacterized protein n=1 Tax=Microbacterium phage Hendrix TaxID=2182341 RepID=A0A2U8UUA2_9CAUD|nr:hypothetical protein HOT31_gp028 [Microbacterium phage Hendrix]AWN07699.1 hypothetical protein PBI_HENDRIX_28 [Microbacterium phage Hendrix]
MTAPARGLPAGTCLHCQQTRAEVKANQTYCATLTTGEYTEVDQEWPRHRWADWGNIALLAAGIKPEYFNLYRRASQWDLEWAACEHLTRGHIPSNGSKEDREWFGTEKGQCVACGKKNVGEES